MNAVASLPAWVADEVHARAFAIPLVLSLAHPDTIASGRLAIVMTDRDLPVLGPFARPTAPLSCKQLARWFDHYRSPLAREVRRKLPPGHMWIAYLSRRGCFLATFDARALLAMNRADAGAAREAGQP